MQQTIGVTFCSHMPEVPEPHSWFTAHRPAAWQDDGLALGSPCFSFCPVHGTKNGCKLVTNGIAHSNFQMTEHNSFFFMYLCHVSLTDLLHRLVAQMIAI